MIPSNAQEIPRKVIGIQHAVYGVLGILTCYMRTVYFILNNSYEFVSMSRNPGVLLHISSPILMICIASYGFLTISEQFTEIVISMIFLRLVSDIV